MKKNQKNRNSKKNNRSGTYSIEEVKKAKKIIFFGFVVTMLFLIIVYIHQRDNDQKEYKISSFSFYDVNDSVFANISIISKKNISNCEIIFNYLGVQRIEKINLSIGTNNFLIFLPDIPYGNSTVYAKLNCEKYGRID